MRARPVWTPVRLRETLGRPVTTTPSGIIAANIVKLRRERGWNRQQLADRYAAIGHPDLTAPAIANIETGRPGKDGRRRRDVTVEEFLATCRAFEAPAVRLLPGLAEIAECASCRGKPPVGYACNRCGAAR